MRPARKLPGKLQSDNQVNGKQTIPGEEGKHPSTERGNIQTGRQPRPYGSNHALKPVSVHKLSADQPTYTKTAKISSIADPIVWVCPTGRDSFATHHAEAQVSHAQALTRPFNAN